MKNSSAGKTKPGISSAAASGAISIGARAAKTPSSASPSETRLDLPSRRIKPIGTAKLNQNNPSATDAETATEAHFKRASNVYLAAGAQRETSVRTSNRSGSGGSAGANPAEASFYSP